MELKVDSDWPTVVLAKRVRYHFRYTVIACLSVGALISLPFDVSLAHYFLQHDLPGELRSLIHKTEFFGHAYGILGIAVTIYLLDEGRRRCLPRLLVTALAAGILCDVAKLAIHRVRPCDFSFAAGEPTFLGLSFLHVEAVGEFYQSSFHSFPSAHTATAVAFAMLLGCLYPRAASWFLVLAGLVAASRVEGGAHYVSDTCVGAVIGYSVACWSLGPSRWNTWFERFELGGRSWPVLPMRGNRARRQAA